ncbi:unnamed protein product [Blepharisma stoltei]|uniref:PPM-type phosphatase domain-containing protein n=1 Tax=Blepharisma stoltei TaxID=1481888 RepID=A0AAU9JKE3_9CILI|nr:unnamed protein product [Blepharisma stoltei]
MGLCLSHSISVPEDPVYPSNHTIKIQEKDQNGRINRLTPINFTIPGPISNKTLQAEINHFSYFISASILPGFDPRGMMNNSCMDNLFLITENDSVFAGLFDGHGRDGLKIVEFSSKFMQDFFRKNSAFIKENPKEMIENMFHQCDEAVQNSSDLDCATSGTTATIIYLNENGLYSASVGNSRAVLASFPKENEEVQQGIKNNKNKYKRTIEPSRVLKEMAITVDQKPNHQEEYERIIQAGGKIQQLADSQGKTSGPYRIWKKFGNLPGLTISRSIGDSIAKEIGVISTPISQFFEIFPDQDQFIIVGSDGIWEALSNIEAVNFVEKFRKKCLRNPPVIKEYPTRKNNSTIAQLVGEEARYRWFDICEQDDVVIDDISVIIIEISTTSPVTQISVNNSERKTIKFKSFAYENDPNWNPSAVNQKLVKGTTVMSSEDPLGVESILNEVVKEEEEGKEEEKDE